MRLANYLFFTACCEQALEFYRSCGLGAVTEMARYGEDGAMRGKVMHARFEGPGVIFLLCVGQSRRRADARLGAFSHHG